MPENTGVVIAPKVEVGWSSKIGWALGIVQQLAAALLLALNGLPADADDMAVIVALVVAGAGTIVKTNDGRQKQAVAAVQAAAPIPDNAVLEDDDDDFEFDEDGGVEDLPDDEVLAQAYPGDHPQGLADADVPKHLS